MNPFHELEAPIHDTHMAVQLLACLFEDVGINAVKNKGPITIGDHEWDLISFVVYDLCKRTSLLSKDFESAFNADAAERSGKTEQAEGVI
ncbi:MAG: hypothetical protein ACOH2N_14990 [Devosia sp.]